MADSTNGLQLNFVERVVSLPAVNIACNVAFETYRNIKASNKLLDITLSTAEKAGNFVVPVMRKFEFQIRVADDMACKALESLKAIAPVISQPPEQVLNSARHHYNETIQNSLNTLETSKSFAKDLIYSEVEKIAADVCKFLDWCEAFISDDNPDYENEDQQPLGSQTELSYSGLVLRLRRLEMKLLREIEQNLQKTKLHDIYNNVLPVVKSLTRLLCLTKAALYSSVALMSPVTHLQQAMQYHAQLVGVQQPN